MLILTLIWGTLKEKGQVDEAITCYRRALELNPNYADAYNNLGLTFKEKGELDEAITCYRRALELNPNQVNAHFNMSLALLLSGNFKQGWSEYEWRWKADKLTIASQQYPRSLFSLAEIPGRTILLHAEQGFGDNIQFIRYAALLVQYGAKVIVECHEELHSLFENIEDIYRVIVFDEQPPLFDLNCPILSLPLIFGTTLETIPENVPYLAASPLQTLKWKERLMMDISKFRVGLVWHGNPKIPHKHLSLNHFAGLFGINDVSFYSLQKGEAAEEAKHPRLIDYTAEIRNFSDTAAIIENLDLIITIDTAVAHLAGALGKPVWTLLRFSPDWRWLLNREDSPWYPTMRLFRQPAPGDWESVITKVKDELLRLLAKN